MGTGGRRNKCAMTRTNVRAISPLNTTLKTPQKNNSDKMSTNNLRSDENSVPISINVRPV